MLQLRMRLAAWAAASALAASGARADATDAGGAGEASPGGARPGAKFVDVLDSPARMTPLASRALLNGITRAGSRLVAIGARGHIVYSDDDGRSWQQASVPVSSDLTAVHFPTPRLGWATGHDGVILHSVDGGASWEKQFDGRDALRVLGGSYREGAAAELAAEVADLVRQGPDKPFLDVWFDSATTGFVVGAFNFIFRTEDGGVTWEPWLDRTENPRRLHLYAIRRIGEELFVAGEQGLLLKLDGSKGSFVSLHCEYNGTFFGLTGKPGAVLAYGLRGNVYRSANGGRTWRKADSHALTTLTAGTVTMDGRIVLVSLLGTVLVSDDDGLTFSPQPSQQSLPAAGIAETGAGSLAIVGMLGARTQSAN